MKMKLIIVAAALVVAAQVDAPDSSANISGSAELEVRPQLHVANPLVRRQPWDKYENKIERCGKMSSRPWTQIVGWHPGEPSSFMDAKTLGTGWPLLWFGAEPKR